jgi:hypothetical protein
MLPGQCLFVSCVLNVATPVSVCILRTKCYQASVCLYLVYPMLPGTGLATLGTQDTNRHWPGNIWCVICIQTRAWQHWVHKIQTDTGLATLGKQDKSVFILCTQCWQASICFYPVYPMLPGQCLFVSCVPNVARPVSVCILCTQCCQASVCLYLGPGNIGKNKIHTDSGLATLGTQD